MARKMSRNLRILSCLGFLCVFSAGARAASIAGTYSGRYQCGRWNTVELKISESGGGRISGVFTFPLASMGMPGAASYALNGQYNDRSGRVLLQPHHWVGPQPPGFPMVGMDGTFDATSRRLSGKMMDFTCGAFELAPGASGAAISQTVPVPAPVLPPERRNAASNVVEAWMGTFEYLDAAMSDGLGPVRESEPIDDAFDRLSSEKLSCIGTTRVSWDGSGTKGTAADRVNVTERFVIECNGDCRGVRYSPQVSAAVVHFGLTSPAPMMQIKTTWASGTAFRWQFTRPAGAQPPPEIFLHKWTAGKFNNGSPGCQPPKAK